MVTVNPPSSGTHTTRLLWLVAFVFVVLGSAGCSDDTETTSSDDTGSMIGDSDTSAPPPDTSTTQSRDMDYQLDLPHTQPPDTGGGDVGGEDTSGVIVLADGVGGDINTPTVDITIDEVYPPTGPSEGLNQVQIFGEGFVEGMEVYFGAQRSPLVRFVDDNELDVTVPSNDAGTVNVKVITEGGVATLVDAYSYTDSIKIDTIDPTRSPTRGGMPFTIEGAGFDGEVFVTIGDRSAVSVQVLDDARLSGITPPNAEGPAGVRVTSEAGSVLTEAALVYYTPTVIADLHPGAGDSAGGDTVIITGDGFEGAVNVMIGGAPAAIVNNDKTSLEVITPAGTAGAVDVQVSSDNGSYTLVDGFLFLDDPAAAFDVVDVQPDSGSASGGQVAIIRGTGFDSGPTVTIGGQVATILDATPTSLRVEVPAGSGGAVVDVFVEVTTPPASELLTGAYTYYATIAGAAPASGDAAGGETVTISGEGFDADAQVFFGAIEATVTGVAADGSSITVTTPPGAGGSVDIIVEQLGYEVALDDAFFYSTALDVFALNPRRGSQAGGTIVTVVGKGFGPDAAIFIDDVAVDAVDVSYINTSTLTFKTPAHGAGIVEVKVEQDGAEELSPDIFTFYDPSSQFGGGWGSTVEGNFNITVLDQSSNQPIESAFVIVSADTSTTFQGVTDTLGQITFSGTDLSGVQSVTASAEEYSSSTITSINAENITLFLVKPSDGDGEPPPPPPTPDPAFIHGTITGVSKVSLSNESNLVKRAMIITSETLNPNDPNPDPGPGGTVDGDEIVDGVGSFRIQSRIGTVAVIGLCGIYNTATDVFSPKFAAIERYIQVPPGSDIEVHLSCDTGMTLSPLIKLVGAPVGLGTDLNVIFPILEIGPEGFLTEPWFAQGTTTSFQFSNLIPLEGPFEDMRYDIQALSLALEGGGVANYPESVIVFNDVTDFSAPLEMGPMMGIPQMITPRDGDTLTDTRVEWTISNSDTVDLFEVAIFGSGFPPPLVWDAYMPGAASGFDLPDTTGLPGAPASTATGSLLMLLSAVKMNRPNFDFNDFTLLDTSLYGHGSHLSWSTELISFVRP